MPAHPPVEPIEGRPVEHPAEPHAAPVGPLLDRGPLPTRRPIARPPPQARRVAGPDVAATNAAPNTVLNGVPLPLMPVQQAWQPFGPGPTPTSLPTGPRQGPATPGSGAWRPGPRPRQRAGAPGRRRTRAFRVGGPPHRTARAGRYGWRRTGGSASATARPNSSKSRRASRQCASSRRSRTPAGSAKSANTGTTKSGTGCTRRKGRSGQANSCGSPAS